MFGVISKLFCPFKRVANSACTVIKNILFPPFCFFCKEYLEKRDIFCKSCYKKIIPVVTHTVQVTQKYSVKIFAISDYKDPIRSLILSKGNSDIVSSYKLGELIWELTYLKNAEFDIIVPIPLHWQRYAQRGFNQAEKMAQAISQKSGKPVINLLRRKKMTKRQSGLTPEKRILNLSRAFELTGDVLEDIKNYKNKKILIVDDLFTTGSTIKFATKELLKLKPAQVIVAVAARVT